MVLFGFILLVSVAALVGVQRLDIECERPRKVKPYRVTTQKSGFPAESMGLRRI